MGPVLFMGRPVLIRKHFTHINIILAKISKYLSSIYTLLFVTNLVNTIPITCPIWNSLLIPKQFFLFLFERMFFF